MEIRFGIAALLASSMLAAPAAFAQEASGGDGEIARNSEDDVIVIARRREENVQDVPLAISVLSQDTLDDFNIESVGDLQSFTPGLQAFGPYRDQPIVSLRGQGGYTPGGIPSVLMYLNEVPAATSAQAGSPGGMLGGNDLFYDLQSVQVLKGPQGTLFGRNTTGGAVLVQSRRPDDAFGGYINLTAGNFEDREVEAALNISLIDDTLAVRLAVAAQDREGFTHAASTPSHPDGLDLDDVHFFSGRISILYTPTSAIENLAIFDYINSDTNGTSSILADVTTSPAHPINNPLSPLYAFNSLHALLAAQDARGIRDVGPLSSDMSASLERWSFTDSFSLEINPNLTFRSIVNYQNARYARIVDGDGTILPVFDPVQSQSVPFETTQYSAETQLQFSDLFGGTVDGIFGLFYLESPEADGFSNHTNVTFGRRKTVGIRNSESSRAIFGQTDVDLSALTEGLSLTAGLRYTWDSIYRSQREVSIPAGTCVSPFAGPDCVSARSGDFEAPTWTLGLNYELSPNTLLYVSTRRGYRSGGFNLDGETPVERVSFDSETVTDVEVGAKFDWLFGDVSGRTNVAAYQQWYSDIQLSQTVPSIIPGSTLTYIVNGGEAEIRGLEIEQRLYFGDLIELGMQTSLIDFEYTEINPGVNLPVIPTVADYTYGIDAAVHLMTSDTAGDITVRAAWNVTGGRYTASLTDPNAYQDEFALLTLGADWRNVGGRPVDLTFFMTNATDEEFQVGSLPLTGSLGVASIAYGEPRMWGVRLGYRFGADGN